MPERLSKSQRSRNMAAIRSKDSKPEIRVRSIVHRLGYRFRLHQEDIQGRPDMVLRRLNALIFVHGCFWHLHHCRRGKLAPVNNAMFWRKKRSANALRDRKQLTQLRRSWKVLVIWECQLRSPRLEKRLLSFLQQCEAKVRP
jgi:DNA mismatch endonuclease, patch repair protein